MFEIFFNEVFLEGDVNEIINIVEMINQIKSGFFDKTIKLSQKYKVLVIYILETFIGIFHLKDNTLLKISFNFA